MNPYACVKVFAHSFCHMYRQAYNMFITVGIFYNHELPRRTEFYVTPKITRLAARIKRGLQDKLVLGDMNALVDWDIRRNIWKPLGGSCGLTARIPS
jgi:GDPmannose 4,6-dehydratase